MVMEKLNGASNNWASKFLFGFISVTFVISSMAGYLYTRTDNSAAKVNGEEISQHAFQNQYNIASRNLSPQEADSPAQVANLKRQILSSLIDQELLRQYTNELLPARISKITANLIMRYTNKCYKTMVFLPKPMQVMCVKHYA